MITRKDICKLAKTVKEKEALRIKEKFLKEKNDVIIILEETLKFRADKYSVDFQQNNSFFGISFSWPEIVNILKEYCQKAKLDYNIYNKEVPGIEFKQFGPFSWQKEYSTKVNTFRISWEFCCE